MIITYIHNGVYILCRRSFTWILLNNEKKKKKFYLTILRSAIRYFNSHTMLSSITWCVCVWVGMQPSVRQKKERDHGGFAGSPSDARLLQDSLVPLFSLAFTLSFSFSLPFVWYFFDFFPSFFFFHSLSPGQFARNEYNKIIHFLLFSFHPQNKIREITLDKKKKTKKINK